MFIGDLSSFIEKSIDSIGKIVFRFFTISRKSDQKIMFSCRKDNLFKEGGRVNFELLEYFYDEVRMHVWLGCNVVM